MHVEGRRQLFDFRSRSVGAADDTDVLAQGVRVALPECQAKAAEDLVNSLVSVPELTIFCQNKVYLVAFKEAG